VGDQREKEGGSDETNNCPTPCPLRGIDVLCYTLRLHNNPSIMY
jgi:hypothetical protein